MNFVIFNKKKNKKKKIKNKQTNNRKKLITSLYLNFKLTV